VGEWWWRTCLRPPHPVRTFHSTFVGFLLEGAASSFQLGTRRVDIIDTGVTTTTNEQMLAQRENKKVLTKSLIDSERT
jgi:hypothetical protein